MRQENILTNLLRAALTSMCLYNFTIAVELEWANVGDPGNSPDFTGFGGVDFPYQIGKFEITNGQYADFLNAIAKADPNELFTLDMQTSALGGIERTGQPGEFTYAAAPDRALKPVLFVSFWDTLRFVNWLENGKPAGSQTDATTENGTYHLTTDAIAKNQIERKPGATYFLPSVDEWYKAAYYHSGGIEEDYWLYPTQSDEPPIPELPPGGVNSANFHRILSNLTDVGSYPDSSGPYGTYDQAGNAFEWIETQFDDCCRTLRGGSWHYNINLMSSVLRDDLFPHAAGPHFGFRVARVPEPVGGLPTLAMILISIFVSLRRRVVRPS